MLSVVGRMGYSSCGRAKEWYACCFCCLFFFDCAFRVVFSLVIQRLLLAAVFDNHLRSSRGAAGGDSLVVVERLVSKEARQTKKLWLGFDFI